MGYRAHCLFLLPVLAYAEIRGGALAGERVLAWGSDGLQQIDPGSGSAVKVAGGDFGRGGCVFDGGVAVHEPGGELGNLVRFRAPEWRRELIDTGADFDDCLEATLFGRRGLLVVHRRAQVRFYEPPQKRGSGRWRYREIYSIYTPSDQGGLQVADVDGDSRPDILCGNYWIQSPAAFEMPWRLFAINNWWEGPQSAMLRLAILPAPQGQMWIAAAQSDASPARFSRFTRPADPKQFWVEEKVEVPAAVHRVGALLAHNGMVYVGERRGEESRLMELRDGKLVRSEVVGDVLEIWPWSDGLLLLQPGGLRGRLQ